MEINSNERAFIGGRTGSGKSVLMKKFYQQFDRVIFVDPKCQNNDVAATVRCTSVKEIPFDKLKNEPRFCVLLQPSNWTEQELASFCTSVLKMGNVTVFFDELMLKTVDEHRTLIRIGRSKGIGLWHITQRPMFIDNYILSECEHFFVFQLQMQHDRDKLKGIMGEGLDEYHDSLQEYEFIYYTPKENKLRKFNPVSP